MLADGLGVSESVNVVFDPSTLPPGESLSINDAPTPPVLPPKLPQAPDEPSTCKQSEALPVAPSIDPSELITAARLGVNAGPSSGRAARSAIRPVTCDSEMGPVVISPPVVMAPAVALLTLTALTRTGWLLAGTDQNS